MSEERPEARETVYVETSVISYLTSKPSGDLVVRAHQELTKRWWADQRHRFRLFISPFVLTEIQGGDAQMAADRVTLVSGIEQLDVTEDAYRLATALIDGGPLPPKAKVDAYHIAVATVNGIDYLLTWNFKHIANATLRSRIEAICTAAGYEPPIMCSPAELGAGEDVERPDR